MDDLVANFIAITSADARKATQYLNVTDGNLEQAVGLYFESGGVDMEGSPTALATTAEPLADAAGRSDAAPRSVRYREDEGGYIHVDSDDEGTSDVDVATTQRRSRPEESVTGGRRVPLSAQSLARAEDDEAMARRLQEEMYAGADQETSIRAPMARTTETLVGGPSAGYGDMRDEVDAAISAQLAARRQGRTARPGIFNQSMSVWEDRDDSPASRHRILAQATGGASTASSKSNMLAEMYRPPFELITRLRWDDAREKGKSEEKWLLVDVQDPAVFDCQVLNRDIWRNVQIKETIQENFLFMQYSKDDPQGSSYMQYYFTNRESQDAYPHIAIVDPRTGEQVKVWSGPPVPKPVEFLTQLHEFLDRYSLKVDARNPIAKRKPERKRELDVERMTEEEMLEMAMQNSLDNSGGPRQSDPDDLTRSVGETGKGKARSMHAEELEEADTQMQESNGVGSGTAFSQISASNPHMEPPADPASTTRIQFRYSGGRQVRRFSLSDPVRRIYEWLKAAPLEGKEGVDFELVFMGKNLIDLVDRSIEEVGLKNGTVMVELLEN